MSNLEEGTSPGKIAVLEGHEPGFNQLGSGLGGAGEVATIHSQMLHSHDLLHGFLTRAHTGETIGHHTKGVVYQWAQYLDHAPHSDEVLQDEGFLEQFVNEVDKKTHGAASLYTHYYRSGLASLLLLDKRPDQVHFHMAHTWLRSTNMNNPGRGPNPFRDEIEQQLLAHPRIKILIQTHAELAEITQLYAADNPELAALIQEKTRVVRLGMPEEYHEAQFMPPREREICRHLAKMRLVESPAYAARAIALENQIMDPSDYRKRKAVALFSVGRFAEGKGQVEQVQAFGEAMKMDPKLPAVLVLVGGFKDHDPYYQKVRAAWAAIDNKSIQDRIHFLGAYPDNEVVQMFLDSGVFLGNSYRESWHLALTKPVAAGAGFIATDDAIRREILKTGTEKAALGFFVPPGDVDGLANAMIKSVDPEYLQEAAHQNPIAMEEYTWENSLQDVLNATRDFGITPRPR